MSGFGSLEYIYASLQVQRNDSLLSINGFSSLVGVGGSFAVSNNPSLCISSVDAVGAALEFLGDEESSTTNGNDNSC